MPTSFATASNIGCLISRTGSRSWLWLRTIARFQFCASVHISEAVYCAGVVTQAGYRQRVYAVGAVASWAIAVRARGATPFYSTSCEHLASQRVAAPWGY